LLKKIKLKDFNKFFKSKAVFFASGVPIVGAMFSVENLYKGKPFEDELVLNQKDIKRLIVVLKKCLHK
jgi:hypothetical protein